MISLKRDIFEKLLHLTLEENAREDSEDSKSFPNIKPF